MRVTAIIIVTVLLLVPPLMAGMIMDPLKQRLTVFYSNGDRKGIPAVLAGMVSSFSAKSKLDENDLYGRSQEKSRVTVRLYSAEGISTGQQLYIVNDRNLVVGKMVVTQIFTSKSFGPMLVGHGNFRQSSLGDRVVQNADEARGADAFIYKARGDYYRDSGDEGEAINQYKQAIAHDNGYPEAHLALGYIYKQKDMEQFAFREFQEAYKHLSRMYDNEDRFFLLKGMAEIRFRHVYESYVPETAKAQYRNEGIGYCREALKVYPESVKMNYYLGIFHYKNPAPDDSQARGYFQRVLELNPNHIGASIGLSELYYRHGNMGKARQYAERALAADPNSRRARTMLNYIERYQEGAVKE